MLILFQSIFFFQKFISCISCFRLFTKIKKGNRTSFWGTFSAYYFHKNTPYLILYQLTQFSIRPTFLLKISNNMFLNSCLSNWWRHKLLDLSSFNFSSNGWRGKRREEGNKRIWISLERKKLSRRNKKHFW